MIELGTIKKDWRFIDLSFGLVYPNEYELGISSYTIRLLYYFINSEPNFVCERFFLPKKIKLPASINYSSVNRLRSLENQISPVEFDILGFSIHYENDLKNVLWMIEKSEIPLYSEKRRKHFNNNQIKYPLLIGGGPVITSNPLPLKKILDLFFIGDSEPSLNQFLNYYLDFKTNKTNFQTFLKKSDSLKGIYIPNLGNITQRSVLKDLNSSPIPIFQLHFKSSKENKIFGENFFVEINRGCPYQCKFCISSFHNAPFRNRSYKNIIASIKKAVSNDNFDKISLIGSCVSSHPNFYEICEFIIKEGKKISIPSIRIDHLTPKLIDILEQADVKTITIAPETGSESLRFSLGKKISNKKLFDILKIIKDSTIRNIKFYFLIGLPNETDEDIEQIISILKEISELGFDYHTLKVNVNPFVPKFNTPYENEIYYYLSKNLKQLVKKYKKLEKALKKITSIKLKFQNPNEIVKEAKIQTIFSLGDEKVGDLLVNYYLNGANFGALRRAEKQLGLEIDNYLLKVFKGYKPWQI